MGPAGASLLAGPPELSARDDGPLSNKTTSSRMGGRMKPANDTRRHDLDAAVDGFLVEAYEISRAPILAFNDTAVALAAKANRDRRVIEGARRVVQNRLEVHPDHLSKQVASLLRRALELGEWDWE